MLIMKDTLNQMGFDYTEIGDSRVSAKIGRYPISIDSEKGLINYDEDDRQVVNSLKQEYMISWYRDKAIREGMQLKSERQANGDVVLTLLRT
jgi:hypothetical protein